MLRLATTTEVPMPCRSIHHISSDGTVLSKQMGEVSIKTMFSKVFSRGLVGYWAVTSTAWFCMLLKFLPQQLRTFAFDTLVSLCWMFSGKKLSTQHWNRRLRFYKFQAILLNVDRRRLSVCTWESSFNVTHAHNLRGHWAAFQLSRTGGASFSCHPFWLTALILVR